MKSYFELFLQSPRAITIVSLLCIPFLLFAQDLLTIDSDVNINGNITSTNVSYVVDSVADLEALDASSLPEGTAVDLLGYYTPGDGGGGRFLLDQSGILGANSENGGTVFVASGGINWYWKRDFNGNVLSVRWFGARANGDLTGSGDNDTAGIERCMVAASLLTGNAVVEFPTGIYKVSRVDPSIGYKSAGIKIRANTSVDFKNSTILLTEPCRYIQNDYSYTTAAQITTDVTAGDTTLNIDDVSNLSVGDIIGVRLVDSDVPLNGGGFEAKHFYFAQVTAIDEGSSSVTLDTPSPADMTESTTGVENKRIYQSTNSIHKNQFIKNVRLDRIASLNNIEAGIDLRFAVNCQIENVWSTDIGAGHINAYGFGNHWRNIWVERSEQFNNQNSKGRGLNVWNSVDCVWTNIHIQNFEGIAIFTEVENLNLRFHNIIIHNNWNYANNSTRSVSYPFWFIGNNSQVHLDGLKVTGAGGYPVFSSGGSPYKLHMQNVELGTDSKVKGGFNLKDFQGGDLIIDGSKMGALQKQIIQFEYESNWTDHKGIKIPHGLYQSFKLHLSDNTGVGNFYVKTTGVSGGPQIMIPIPPDWTVAGGTLTQWGTDYPYNKDSPRYLALYSGTVGPETTATLVIEYFPFDANDNNFLLIN